jgi:hypothetical protein
MRTAQLVRTLIVMLALEWQLGQEDPVIFCYRIGVQPARLLLGRYSRQRQDRFV